MSIADNLERIKSELEPEVTLVAVSKYSSDREVQDAYDAGHRDFGENKAQDVAARKEDFPDDVQWHFIGHLQRNKVKYIAPFVHMIHSVDSLRLLREINKRAKNENRVIPCLLQMHIAKEESKFGLDRDELNEILADDQVKDFQNVRIRGLMGMATNTENESTVRSEFEELKELFDELKKMEHPLLEVDTLSMGMSQDYKIALECGTNMVRIGSAVFKS
jgi:pyridoxal phosphate enzyme (YggS family)